MGMANANKITPQYLARALRLPFITASALPFIFGSLLAKQSFNLVNFLLGLICVVSTHLSANLLNDYADSQSGADWKDKRFFKFFGGSKLIQEKILSTEFYLSSALICFGVALFSIFLLAFIQKSLFIITLYLCILLLSWSYSAKPLAFSYHRFGEIIIFLLFGQATVMGGYYIQTRIFPTLEGFLLSLPFGLLTTAILFANEIPDFPDDLAAGKFTWVSIAGPKKAYNIYLGLILLAFFVIIEAVFFKLLSPLALVSLIFLLPAFKASAILKKYYANKEQLVVSSKLTIAIQALVSIILILSIL